MMKNLGSSNASAAAKVLITMRQSDDVRTGASLISPLPFPLSKMRRVRSWPPRKSPGISRKANALRRGSSSYFGRLDHHVKNLFALSISVLNLSGRSANSVPQLVESASARLSALARAHALTLSHGPDAAPRSITVTTLHSLIEAIIEPHRGEGENRRLSIVGCDIEISGSVISSLALLLNEFATNSVKYGALSATAGRIQIHCADRAGAVVISWTE